MSQRPTIEEIDRLNERALDFISGEDPKKLLELGESACNQAREISYKKGESYALVNMGFGLWFLSDHGAAVEKLSAAQSLFEELDDRTGYMRALVALLGVQKDRGSYDQSLSNSLVCLKYFRETGDALWECLSLLGLQTLYYDVGDYAKCLQCSEEVTHVAEAIGKQWIVARALVHKGTALRKRGEDNEAASCFERSLRIFESEGNRMGEARALTDLGVIYQRRGESDRALEYHRRALVIREAIGQKQAQCTSLVHLGDLYLEQEDVTTALEFLNRALETATAIGSKPRIYRAHHALARAYEHERRFAEALEHHRKYQETKEEVFSDETTAHLKDLQTQFEVEAKEKEAEIERLRNVELKEKNDRLEALLAELRATQAQLVHAEKMASLGKLVAGVAHELNSPLGALSCANDVVAQCLVKLREILDEGESIEVVRESRELRKVMALLEDDTQVISRASSRLSELVNNLRRFARLDEAEFQKADIREGLDSALELLKGQISDGIELVKDYADVPEIMCYPGELNQVFLALLTNAAEAIPERGTIRVEVRHEEPAITVAISDTGKGIPKGRLSTLFDFDFSSGRSRVKLGSSLATAHKIVQGHGGGISVTSEAGRGSVFTVRLPTDTTLSPK
jgi:two-component system NtrC family sensor kinase